MFLEGNSNLERDEFWSQLPVNAADLCLGDALHVISAAKQNRSSYLPLFVGIDDYHMIPRNHVGYAKKDPLTPLLLSLLEAMIEAHISKVVILPVFAGTDKSRMLYAG